MATIYVSYKSDEQAFVSQVVDLLEHDHRVNVDYRMPAGAPWRDVLPRLLKESDVFVVFVSAKTRGSSLQNSEIGAARFASTFVSQKLIIPVIIDQTPIPETLKDLDCVLQTSRDPAKIAREINDAVSRRTPPIQLFLSHSHSDVELAGRLVDVITAFLEVPLGAIRCTSVPGYKLDLGVLAPEVLRRELGSAECVVALLTPNSLSADWVLFELGAAWANAKHAIPLLAGGLKDKDIPGPFRGMAAGDLTNPATLDQLIDQLKRTLNWSQKADLTARTKLYDLAKCAAEKLFLEDEVGQELRATFGAKRALIGSHQGEIIDYIAHYHQGRAYVPQEELYERFRPVETHLYYRLEQLRYLGFLRRQQTGTKGGKPDYGWALTKNYLKELGP